MVINIMRKYVKASSGNKKLAEISIFSKYYEEANLKIVKALHDAGMGVALIQDDGRVADYAIYEHDTIDLLDNTDTIEINSSESINCVGHNDPGRYFDLIDYFDVWGNEEDGWEVNDQTVVEDKIWISDDTTEEELFNYLKDTVGYFNRNTKFSDVEIQWDDPDFIEIFQASDGCPVCSLRVSYRE